MIDYCKIHSLAIDVENLLNNERLMFPLSNVATTGEMLNRWQVSQYKGLTFKVKSSIVRLEFSPHKYYEGGKTNFCDFHLNNIQDVISEISATFDFEPEKSVLNFIEIGVNIRTDVDPNKLIDCFVCYLNKPFEQLKTKGKGYGRICSKQQFDIKVYNKSLQNDLDYHLLRFEVKVKKMEFLKRYGIKSLTLADLTTQEFYADFKKMLLDVFKGILMFNPEITPDDFINQKDRELFIEGRYAKFWQDLERTKRHRQIKRFAELAGCNKIKNELQNLILEKCNELTTCNKIRVPKKLQQNNRFQLLNKNNNLQQNNRFQESDKNNDLQRNNLSINCYNVAYCSVTGLQIYNQRPGTKYLSVRSIQWYYENKPETYKNQLEILLTQKWLTKHRGEPMKNYFAEIYHQIRNKDRNPKNNPRNNTKNSYRKIERKGLKLWPMDELVDPEKLKLIV